MYLVRPSFFARNYYSTAMWRVAAAGKTIYLTFDDGPHPEITPWVLDVLNNFNAKATFFCVGENVKKHKAVFDRIINENHAVGNHTFNHLNGWKTRDEIYLDKIGRAHV